MRVELRSAAIAFVVLVAPTPLHAATKATTAATTQALDGAVQDELGKVLKEMQTVVVGDVKPTSQPMMQQMAQRAATIENAAEQSIKWRADAEKMLTVKVGPDIERYEGDHTDLGNQAFIAQAKNILQDFKVEVPAVNLYLLKQNDNHKLTGTRLELLTRLIAGDLELMMQAVKTPRKN